MALTGTPHVSKEQFAQKISSAYHNSVMRHFELMTGAGKPIGLEAKVPSLLQGILTVCNMNLAQHNPVNWVQQVGKFIQIYWAGAFIQGSIGFVNVLSVGSWISVPVPANTDFNLILYAFESAARIHLMTLTGTYTSTVTGVVTPWSGASLQTIP